MKQSGPIWEDKADVILSMDEILMTNWLKIQNLNFFKKKNPKYCSEAVLYSKQMAGYPLSRHIKTIAVAFLQAE